VLVEGEQAVHRRPHPDDLDLPVPARGDDLRERLVDGLEDHRGVLDLPARLRLAEPVLAVGGHPPRRGGVDGDDLRPRRPDVDPDDDAHQRAFTDSKKRSRSGTAARSSVPSARPGASSVRTVRPAWSSSPAASSCHCSAGTSLTGTPAPRRWATQAATATTAPWGMRPAARSVRSTGTWRTGSFWEPSAAMRARTSRIRGLAKRSASAAR